MRMSTKQSDKTGMPQGSAVYIGKKRKNLQNLRLIGYSQSCFCDYGHDLSLLEKNLEGLVATNNYWIHVVGLQDVGVIRELGAKFKMHPLLLEDVLNTGHRPKFESIGGQLFLTLKLMEIDEGGKLVTNHLSFVLTSNVVVSFLEKEHDVFNQIYLRIKEAGTKIRGKTIDYLFYALIDIVIDQYFGTVEKIGDWVEDLELDVFNSPDKDYGKRIQDINKVLFLLQRVVIPTKDAISKLMHTESELLHQKNRKYLSDVFDHILQINDNIETYRHLNQGLWDMYMSAVGRRSNQVMQLLTIVSTLFIPLTFIVGVYGMNFDFMPELHWKYGYLAVILFMIFMSILLVLFFKKKKWL